MINKKFFICSIFLLSNILLFAQSKNVWNGKKCAVSLTYDDALNINLDKVIPALDSVKLKGTFYLIASAKPFTNRLKEWKVAASHGHEIANHSLFHPCASGPGRSFVTADYDLKTYSIRRINDEMRMANTMFEAMMSEDAFKEFPNILSTVQRNKDTAYLNSLSRRGGGGGREIGIV